MRLIEAFTPFVLGTITGLVALFAIIGVFAVINDIRKRTECEITHNANRCKKVVFYIPVKTKGSE